MLVQSCGDAAYRGRIYLLRVSLTQVGAFITGVPSQTLGARAALGATSLALVLISLSGILLFPKLCRLA